MKKLAAGNWKMNGTGAALAEVTALLAAHPTPACEVLLCPPATLIARMAEAAAGSALCVGGQDCHPNAAGAHTGDISAGMLKDAGASHVIVGHSERRADHGESDALIRAKAEAALAAGLVAVVCIGETEADRDAGQTLPVIGGQLDGSLPAGATAATVVIAYEPVWAIGTGLTPTTAEVAEAHAHIRGELAKAMGEEGAKTRILYGGSVKPSNASELMSAANVNGALVGGASLKAADFIGIIKAYM
jgi:triosephosphate isomerase